MPQDENKIRLADALAKAEETTTPEGFIPVITGDSEPYELKKVDASFIDEISEIKNDVENLESEVDNKANQTDLESLSDDLHNNYFTKSDCDNRYITSAHYDGFITSDELETALEDYYTKSDVDDLISDFVTSDELDNYVSKEEYDSDKVDLQNQIDELESDKMDKFNLSDYYTKSDVDNLLNEKVDKSEYNSDMEIIEGFMDETESNIENLYDIKADRSVLNNYYTKSDIDSDFVTFGQLEEKLSDYYTSGQIEEKISEFLTSADLDDYVTGSDLTNILSDYVTNSDLDSTLSDYVTEEELSNILSDYVTQSDLNEVMDVVFGKADQSDLDSLSDDLHNNYYTKSNVYNKSEIDSKIVGAMHYKGTKPDFAHLPDSGNEVGDMWNVLSDGENYAWDGSDWDMLSPIIDLSGKADKSELNALDSDLHNNYYDSDTIDNMLSTKVDESELDNYVTSDVYNSGINDLQEQIDNLSSDIELLSDALDNYVTKEYLSDNYYTSGQIDEMFENIDLADLTNVKNYTIDNKENVIVINPNLNSSEEVTGKLYATFEAVRDYTSSSGNADRNFIIKLPADEFNEHIIVDENMTIIGNKTKLYGGVDSTCELPYTGVVKNCIVGYNDMHIGIVRNGVNILGLTGNNSSNNYKGVVTFVECEVGTEWWDCEDSDTSHYEASHVLKDIVVIDRCYIFGKEYAPRSTNTKAVQYNVNIANSIIGSKGQRQSDFRIGLDWAVPTAYLNNLKSTISISNTIIERDISFICHKAKINLKLNNVISQYRQKFIDRGSADWANTISLNNCNFKAYFDGYHVTPEINECNIDELSIYNTYDCRIANSNVKLSYTFDSTLLYVNEHSTIKIDNSFSNSYGNCNIYLDHCSHLVEPNNPSSDIGAYIVNYSSDNIDKQIEDLKTNIVTIANGDSSISNNECSLTLSNNTIYDITATGLTSIDVTATTGTLDFISQLNFSTYNSSGIKPALTLPPNSKIIDTNDCIDSISSNTITFITNYRITMICYYDGSQYRFVFQGA